MSTKQIDKWRLDEISKEGPVPSKWELEFKTNDGWYYIYAAAQEGDPFIFRLKRRPDGSASTDNITPRKIRSYFEDNPTFELVDEKIIYRGPYKSQTVIENPTNR